jgi:hypothetical protein
MKEEWVENFVYILELILMVEVWLKKESFPREHVMDPSRLGKAIGFYMDRLTQICPREGMGSLLIKNHLMFHLPQYILRWGPPSGWDSSTLERSHKTQAKRPAQLTQQRPETFTSQLAARYCDLRIVKRFREKFHVNDLFKERPKDVDLTGEPGQEHATNQMDSHAGDAPAASGSLFEVGIDHTGNAGVKWKNRPGRQSHLQSVQDLVAEVIVSRIEPGEEKVVEGFTEYKTVINGERVLFRAHPSYRSASRQQRDVWYDWALFDLKQQNAFPNTPIPGQILMFVHVPFIFDEVTHRGIRLIPNEPHAVVRLFQRAPDKYFRKDRSGKEPYSYLVHFGNTRDHYHIIPCRYIHSTTIVVPNIVVRPPKVGFWNTKRKKQRRKELDGLIDPLGPGYFVVSPKFDWGECFGRLIGNFHATSQRTS